MCKIHTPNRQRIYPKQPSCACIREVNSKYSYRKMLTRFSWYRFSVAYINHTEVCSVLVVEWLRFINVTTGSTVCLPLTYPLPDSSILAPFSLFSALCWCGTLLLSSGSLFMSWLRLFRLSWTCCWATSCWLRSSSIFALVIVPCSHEEVLQCFIPVLYFLTFPVYLAFPFYEPRANKFERITTERKRQM